MITKDFKMKRKTDIEKIVGLAEQSLQLVLFSTNLQSAEGLGVEKFKGRIIAFHIAYTNGEKEDLTFFYLSKGASEHNPDFPALEIQLHLNDDKMAKSAFVEWNEESSNLLISQIRGLAEDYHRGAKNNKITGVSVEVCG